MNDEISQTLVIGGLRLADDRIEELQDGRPIAHVMHADIQSVQLRHGFLARHPIVQLIFGILLSAASGIVTLAALLGFTFEKGLLAGAFVLLGLWVIYDSMHRGHYLLLHTSRGIRKLVVGRNLDLAQLAALQSRLDTRFWFRRTC